MAPRCFREDPISRINSFLQILASQPVHAIHSPFSIGSEMVSVALLARGPGRSLLVVQPLVQVEFLESRRATPLAVTAPEHQPQPHQPLLLLVEGTTTAEAAMEEGMSRLCFFACFGGLFFSPFSSFVFFFS